MKISGNRKIKIKMIVFSIIVLVILILIFPKKSAEWGSAVGIQKSCSCFGVEYNIFPEIEGSTLVYCFGIPYNCTTDLK